MVVAGPLALGARLARDLVEVPFATVQLAPASLPSESQPPHLPGLALSPRAPRWPSLR